MSLRHFHLVLAGDVLAKAMTAGFVLLLVNRLLPAELASYVYLSSLVVFSVTSLSGFFNRHYVLHGESLAPARAYRRFQVVAAIFFFLIAFWIGVGALSVDVVAALGFVAGFAAFEFKRTHAQRAERFDTYAMADIARTAGVFAGSVPVFFLLSSHRVTALLAVNAAAYFLAAWLLPSLPRSTSSAPIGELLRRVLGNRASMLLVVYFLMVALYSQLPVLLLESLGDTQALASLGSAFRYYGVVLSLVVAANVVLLPRIMQSNDEDFRSLLHSAGSIVAVGAGMVAAAAVAGYVAIPWIDGGKYPQAPLLFVVLSAALLPGMMLAPLTAIALRREQWLLLVISQTASAVVCASVFLAFQRHGALAAAAGLPAGSLTQMSVLLAFARADAQGAACARRAP